MRSFHIVIIEIHLGAIIFAVIQELCVLDVLVASSIFSGEDCCKPIIL